MNVLYPYLLWKKLGILQTGSLFFFEVLISKSFLKWTVEDIVERMYKISGSKPARPDGFTLVFKRNSRMRLMNYEQ